MTFGGQSRKPPEIASSIQEGNYGYNFLPESHRVRTCEIIGALWGNDGMH